MMAKIDSTQVAVRIPNDLLALAPEGMSRTDLVIEALRAHLLVEAAPTQPSDNLAAWIERAESAEAQVQACLLKIDGLKLEVIGWRIKAEAKPAGPVKAAIKAIAPSGDIQAAAAVTVTSGLTSFQPRPVGTLAKGYKKGAVNGRPAENDQGKGREAD